ncbi:hypothetical protein EPO15_01455 [bacterium]|nr:MAG: hypothetical protein EPO15_01455 [bacterium]
MPLLTALLFALSLPGRAATSVMSVDPGDPAYEATHDEAGTKGKKKRKDKTPLMPAGDVQVGPDTKRGNAYPEISKRKAPRATKSPAGSRVPGIFAVYEAGGRWMLVEREGSAKPSAGTRFVVIGAHGAGEFRADKSSKTWEAACEGGKKVPRRAWLLSGDDPKAFKRVGTPVIAILLKPGAHFDASRAHFSALTNQAGEPLYQRLENSLRKAVAAELANGEFQMDIGDEEGHRTAANPDPDKIRLKIDFAARLKLAGFESPLLLVEGAEYSRSYRRCLRLVDGDKIVGSCVEMPNELMAETAALNFVAYDPARSGKPFILAFTEKPPLWGHERWGFQNTAKGPKVFLRDALDPRCRDSF